MTSRMIGISTTRVDAVAKVTGNAVFPGDRLYPDVLWMKTLFSGRVHARIVSIDCSRARATPGVVAVLTAEDVPVNEYGLQMADQPVLCGPGSSKEGGDIVRFVGDQVAVVVAESEEIAIQAIQQIDIEYVDLPVVVDPRSARLSQAPRLHPHSAGNVAYHQRVVKGNVDEAWAHCDLIVEGTYQTPPQEHLYLQPEAGSAYVDGEGRITVHVAGQWSWEDQQQIAHSLNIPPDSVRVVYDAIGGAFGGREDMSVQITLALAAMHLQRLGVDRPVKTIWNRSESIVGHCKRHPMAIRARWGATKDGRLVANETEIISDAGAYMYTSNKAMANAILTCPGPYVWPHARIDGYAIYTNNVPGGAFRGFGSPQGAFAAECQMNKIAETLGLSPIAIRRINLLDDESPSIVGTPIPDGVSLQEVMTRATEEAGWDDHSGNPPQRGNLRYGKGIAVGFKNIGFSLGYQENSWARVEVEGDTEVREARLYFAGADVGQGHHTVMQQIAADVLRVPVGRVKLFVSDTAFTKSSGSASASRLTFVAGNAVKGASERAKEMWDNEERPAAAEFTYLAPKTEPFSHEDGLPVKPNFAYGYVAQCVEVAVDMETGFVDVLRVVSAHDVGKAINPKLIVGQVDGGVVQAHGYTVLEDFRTEDGRVLTGNMSTYLIPGVLDIPRRVDTVIVEKPAPNGPFGARGMGEMPYLPYAPAVVAAVREATGIWFDDFPLTPERILRGLGRLPVVADE